MQSRKSKSAFFLWCSLNLGRRTSLSQPTELNSFIKTPLDALNVLGSPQWKNQVQKWIQQGTTRFLTVDYMLKKKLPHTSKLFVTSQVCRHLFKISPVSVAQIRLQLYKVQSDFLSKFISHHIKISEAETKRRNDEAKVGFRSNHVSFGPNLFSTF